MNRPRASTTATRRYRAKETKDPLTDNEMVKGSDKHGVFYQFNRQACFDWLTRNKLTMADKMLEAIDSGDRKSKYDL